MSSSIFSSGLLVCTAVVCLCESWINFSDSDWNQRKWPVSPREMNDASPNTVPIPENVSARFLTIVHVSSVSRGLACSIEFRQILFAFASTSSCSSSDRKPHPSFVSNCSTRKSCSSTNRSAFRSVGLSSRGQS